MISPAVLYICYAFSYLLVAVSYAQSHPTPEGKTATVLFLDQGHGHTTAAVVQFKTNDVTVSMNLLRSLKCVGSWCYN